jgi:hypothetical protein
LLSKSVVVFCEKGGVAKALCGTVRLPGCKLDSRLSRKEPIMEPITTTLLAALVAGAAAATGEVADQAIKDTYNSLKQFVIQKLGGKAGVETALQGLESKPGSQGRQMTLKEELESAVEADPAAAQDPALLEQAQQLLSLLQQAGHPAPGSVQITQSGSSGLAYGPGAIAAGAGGVAAGAIHGPVATGEHARQIQTGAYVEKQVNTGGGAAVAGDVNTGGDFVGRDQIVGGKRE